MSTNMRGLLCVRVMIWVPSDLSHGKLSNKSQYEGAIVWGGDVMGTTGFVSRRAFKWVPIWGVYCVRGWCYGYHWICLIESFQMSINMRGLLCEGVMIWIPLGLSCWELSNESQYEGSIVWGGDDMGSIGFVSLRAFKWVPIIGFYCVRWVPLELSDGELSNEYQYEGSIVWGGDVLGTTGFVSQRAFKWVPIWGVYCVRGWWYGYHRICLTESFQMSTNMRGLLSVRVMIWVRIGFVWRRAFK